MSLKICNKIVKQDSKKILELDVATMSNGYKLKLPLHIINGKESGNKILITSNVHGDECLLVEVAQKMITGIKTNKLFGTIIFVPVANPLAFEAKTRYSPNDGLDLNRVFPGESLCSDPLTGYGGITPKIANVIIENLVKKVDYIVDLHSAPWGSLFEWCGVAKRGGKIGNESLKLGQIFGTGVIRRFSTSKERERSSSSLIDVAANEYSVSSIYTALGGGGFGSSTKEVFIKKNLIGIKNVLKFLNLLDGEPVKPKKQIMSECYAQRPNHGGFHISKVGLDKFLTTVNEGEILGETISPYTFKTLEVMKAPCDGVLCAIRATSKVTHDTIGVPCYYLANTKTGTWFLE
jgi:hypothetical protein